MLEFSVKNQTLTRTDNFKPVTDSVDYLYSRFTFVTNDWSNTTKTAIFRAGDIVKEAKIDSSGKCLIPWEVLVKSANIQGRSYISDNKLYVSVIGENGTYLIPTNEVSVTLTESGYVEADESQDPTPDMYAQYVNEVKADANLVQQTAEDIKAIESDIKNLYSNALKGRASGSAVRVDDVSPVEHNVKVKVSGKNLIVYPHSDTTKTQNGLTFTDNGDGSITVVGTATTVTYYDLCNFTSRFFSGGPRYFNAMSDKVTFEGYTIKDCSIQQGETGNSFCHLVITAGQTVNKTFYPQIEKGDVATEYTPYIDPNTVTVTRCGKNIFDITADELTVIGSSGNKRYALVFDKPGVYTFSAEVDSSLTNIAHKIVTDGEYGEYTSHVGDVKFTETIGENQKLIIYKGLENERLQGGVSRAQLEIGDTASDYEAYNSEKYTVNSDGSVDITSLSPIMTLLTNSEGATVECEYNRDINVVLDNIIDRLNAIGGTS